MASIVEKLTTVVFKDDYGDLMFLTFADRDSEGEWRLEVDETRSDSFDISDFDISDQAEILCALPDHFDGSEFRIVTIETKTTNIDLSQDEYREAIQRIALKKLSSYEIEALGLNKISLYIKTKYHKNESGRRDKDE